MALTRLDYIDMHTAGEPVRIVTRGYPTLNGKTILEKRRDAMTHHDALRRAMNFEPRGHHGMYGVIPLEPSHPEAVLGVLFTHHEGYSTMCGHATLALGRYVIDQGLVKKETPITRFAIEAPCGLLRLACRIENDHVVDVHFESVPAFPVLMDHRVTLPSYGPMTIDLAYGGAFYCIVPSSRFGLDFFSASVDQLREAAAQLTDHIRATMTLSHPDADDLGFLYGTILTDDATPDQESYNLCIFAERQIDRCPTGSGVTARMALDHAKGLVTTGKTRQFRGISGEAFTGKVLRHSSGPVPHATIIEIGGRSFYSGQGTFLIESDDPLGHGFSLATRFADIAIPR